MKHDIPAAAATIMGQQWRLSIFADHFSKEESECNIDSYRFPGVSRRETHNKWGFMYQCLPS